MPRDLFADELVPVPTSRTVQNPRSGASGWVAGVLSLALVALVGSLMFLQSCSPNITPDDGDDVTPSVSGLHVLIIEETKDRFNLPATQIPIFTSTILSDWYDANCAKVDGVRAYRCFDQHDNLDKENPVWKSLKAKVKTEPPSYAIVNGRYEEVGRLPKDPKTWHSVLEKARKGK